MNKIKLLAPPFANLGEEVSITVTSGRTGLLIITTILSGKGEMSPVSIIAKKPIILEVQKGTPQIVLLTAPIGSQLILSLTSKVWKIRAELFGSQVVNIPIMEKGYIPVCL